MAGFLCGLDDGVLVERLDRVHIDHADGNAFLGESVCRRDGQRGERAGGDDGEVGAVEGGDGLADFVVIVLRGIDGRLCAAGDACRIRRAKFRFYFHTNHRSFLL